MQVKIISKVDIYLLQKLINEALKDLERNGCEPKDVKLIAESNNITGSYIAMIIYDGYFEDNLYE